MRFPLILIATLISSGLLAQQPRTLQLKVSSAPDGSTIVGTYKDESGAIVGGTYRLLGIQAPISNTDKGLEQPYWKESKAHLGKIDDRPVIATSQFVGGEEFWKISLLNGVSINFEMVRSGYAWYQPAHGVFPKFAQAQKQQKNQRKVFGRYQTPLSHGSTSSFWLTKPPEKPRN